MCPILVAQLKGFWTFYLLWPWISCPKLSLLWVRSSRWQLYPVEDFLLLAIRSKSLSFLSCPLKNRISLPLCFISKQVNQESFPLQSTLPIFLPKTSTIRDQNLSNQFFVILSRSASKAQLETRHTRKANVVNSV